MKNHIRYRSGMRTLYILTKPIEPLNETSLLLLLLLLLRSSSVLHLISSLSEVISRLFFQYSYLKTVINQSDKVLRSILDKSVTMHYFFSRDQYFQCMIRRYFYLYLFIYIFIIYLFISIYLSQEHSQAKNDHLPK